MKKNKINIDLFSDTKTRPSQEMREYICRAVVGDEQSDEDPTTIELCERVASLLGKERALFLPSGTMCNQTGYIEAAIKTCAKELCGLLEGGPQGGSRTDLQAVRKKFSLSKYHKVATISF